MSDKALNFAMLSDPGRVRSHNEDACAARPKQGVFVVCDGVGGAASGEVASGIAADVFVSSMAAARTAETSLEVALQGALEQANQLVHRQARQTTAQRGMATTLVAMVFDVPDGGAGGGPNGGPNGGSDHAGTIWLANVGDSRCYRFRDGHFEQLTRDHSVVEEQVRSGEITRAQADVSPIRNVITRAIGSEAVVVPDIERLTVLADDLYLLCSDGLTRDLADAEIAATLQANPSANDADLLKLCQLLVQAANEKGGGDNITCLIVRVP